MNLFFCETGSEKIPQFNQLYGIDFQKHQLERRRIILERLIIRNFVIILAEYKRIANVWRLRFMVVFWTDL